MKLFVLKSFINNQYYENAYTDKRRAVYVERCLREYYNRYYEVEEVDLPFIGRSVCYLYLYKGFDYDFYGGKIYNVDFSSSIYPCTDMAKRDELWGKFLGFAKADPAKHIVTDNKVASLDHGEEFFHGDAVAGLFNLEIRRIRVIKRCFEV